MNVDLGTVAVSLLVAGFTAYISNLLAWRRTQREWHHRERYTAVVDLLEQARRNDRLTQEAQHLRRRHSSLMTRIRKLKRSPEGSEHLRDARTNLRVTERRLDDTNARLVDSQSAMRQAAVRIDLLHRGQLAPRADDLTLAYANLEHGSESTDGTDATRSAVVRAEEAFIESARKELGSGRAAK